VRINLTFIFQLLNILTTLWFLKNFFWRELLTYVFNEQKQRDLLSESRAMLEKTLEDSNRSILQEQADLTNALQEKLQRLEPVTKIQVPPPQCAPHQQDVNPELSVIARAVKQIAPIIDKKF